MRAVLISYDDIVGDLIRPQLREYVGVMADIANLTPLLERILDTYFQSIPWMSVMSPRAMLVDDYRLPADIAKDVNDRVVHAVGQSIQYALKVVYPGRHYVYRIHHQHHIAIEEYSPEETCGPIRSTYTTETEDES